MLAGLLCAEVTVCVMKGVGGDELLHWVPGQSYAGELLGFAILAGIGGAFLGFLGAAVATTWSEPQRS